jgi:mannose-6-phosphate isomerase-like protein (cupin superfamily)
VSQFETDAALVDARNAKGLTMKITHGDLPLEEWRAGVTSRMHISALNGATQLCIFEQWIAPATDVPTHQHPVEEVLTVVAGEAEMRIDERRLVLTDWQSLIVPAHRNHGFRNIGSVTLHMHAVLASANFEATFDDGKLVQRWFMPAGK